MDGGALHLSGDILQLPNAVTPPDNQRRPEKQHTYMNTRTHAQNKRGEEGWSISVAMASVRVSTRLRQNFPSRFMGEMGRLVSNSHHGPSYWHLQPL